MVFQWIKIDEKSESHKREQYRQAKNKEWRGKGNDLIEDKTEFRINQRKKSLE